MQYNNGLTGRKGYEGYNLEFPMKKSSAVKSEATFHIEKKMLWLEALSNNQPKRAEQNSFKLTLKSKCGHSFENMKTLFKTKVNPVDMKIGITTFTDLRNR
jgi:hypothetical protein